MFSNLNLFGKNTNSNNIFKNNETYTIDAGPNYTTIVKTENNGKITGKKICKSIDKIINTDLKNINLSEDYQNQSCFDATNQIGQDEMNNMSQDEIQKIKNDERDKMNFQSAMNFRGGNKPKNKKTFQKRDKLGRFIKLKTRKSSGGWLV